MSGAWNRISDYVIGQHVSALTNTVIGLMLSISDNATILTTYELIDGILSNGKVVSNEVYGDDGSIGSLHISNNGIAILIFTWSQSNPSYSIAEVYQSLSYPQSGYVAGRGWWKKDADGTLECWHEISDTPSNTGNHNIGTYGWSYYFTNYTTWTFPCAGLSGATIDIQITTDVYGNGGVYTASTLSNTSVEVLIYSWQNTTSIPAKLRMKTRWK
jgi:hypothetical protein